MMLRTAADALLVLPSLVDNNEEQTATGLHVVTHHAPERKVYRGVVEYVGEGIHEAIARGCVVHYLDFIAIADRHVVAWRSVAAWEVDE